MNKLATALSTTGQQVRRLCADRNGATSVQYAVIASGISVAIVTLVYSLGSNVKGLFTTVSSAY